MEKKKFLWPSIAVTVVLIILAMLQRNEGVSPDPAEILSEQTQDHVAAIAPPPKAEQPPARPRAEPRHREWKVLFTKPPDGKGGVVRSTAVDVFFNVPVERDVVEWAFAISPSIPGNISWPRPDHLVFEPQEPLLPATKYTVSLNSTNGSRGEEAYTLHGARTSFTTGEARTYDKDIRPLVSAYCHSCHGPAGSAAAFPLGTYQDVRRHVVPGRARESRFYTFIQDRQHLIRMAGPNHSTNDKLAVIKDWIDQDKAAQY